MPRDYSIHISISDKSGESFSFSSLKELKRFLNKETKFWKEVRNGLSNEKLNHAFFDASSIFDNYLAKVEVIENKIHLEDTEVQQELSRLQRSLFNNLKNSWLWSGHEYVHQFLDILSTKNAETANAFIDYVANGTLSNIGKSLFDGQLMGYEFAYQDSDLVKRRKAERASISKIKKQFEEANESFLAETEKSKEDFEDWIQLTEKNYDRWSQKLEKRTSRRHKAYKSLAKKEAVRIGEEYSQKVKKWESRITELEHTYQEKLRLEKPATYWKKSASKLQIQGIVFTFILILLISSGIYALTDFFKLWLLRGEQPLNLGSLQGIVLFGAIAAIFAFLARVLARLSFSSFHLMRDAEEREQLTYLYLSLTEDAKVDKESRDIVLQALFSRSETGLLTNENGPSMPNMHDLTNKFTKSQQ